MDVDGTGEKKMCYHQLCYTKKLRLQWREWVVIPDDLRMRTSEVMLSRRGGRFHIHPVATRSSKT
jgi:hypothetical protein